ncbi:GGDEF domain-containing protein [Catenovulum sediminis]|uniref:diguanylate cyclase n=1 Tax=Catenovulum sediminis TaxID=1740262 RepID=A0ABV1RDV0_9ALTE|nr:GGDEF domain-containing protein [Catenovulum sediminis]
MKIVSRDDIKSAKRYGQVALDLLDTWNVPMSPINYGVAYEIAKGKNKSLLAAYKAHTSKNKLIDCFCLEQWQSQYLQSPAPQNDKLISDLEKVVAGVHEQLESNDGSVDKYLEQLTDGIEQIKQANIGDELLPVVDSLLSASRLIKWQQKELKEQLAQSKNETSQLKDKLEQIEQQIKKDPLTGLLNRRGLDEYLQKVQDTTPLLTVAIDIDRFKSINDQYGHLIGDIVIAKVAEQIRQSSNTNIKAIRYGGEEFLLVMPQSEFNRYPLVAEDIRKKVSEMKLVSKKSQQKLPAITVSAGVARQQKDESFEDLVARADTALYAAKNAGRNQVQYAK